jgi:hypothetical protein
MKFVLTLLLTLFVSSALAQAQTPLPPAGPYDLKCLPKEVGGTGTWSTVRTNNAGVTRWHYCNDSFTWFYVFEAYPWSSIGDPANWALFNSVKGNLTAAQSAASANLTMSANAEPLLSVWKPHQPEIFAGFPPSLWVVALNGASTTRPTFTMLNGRRVLPSAGVTPVIQNGQRVPCDMRLRLLEWPLMYGRVPGSNPEVVTVCAKR